MYNIGLSDLTRSDWCEYEEYKTNFEFEEESKYYVIAKSGVREKFNNTGYILEEELVKFNAFPDKELAEFIQKKQLLERELMAFSYLNGANEIDWKNNDNVYCIYCSIKFNNVLKIEPAYTGEKNHFMDIYFKSEEICEKAIELYYDEMKEVMEMKIKLGF